MPVTIYLDREIEFDGNLQYYVNVVSASGVPSRLPIYAASGTASSITFANIWNSGDEPIPGSVYIIESLGINAELYRVVSISEAATSSGGLEYQVTALKYNASKFAAVEQGLVLEEPPTQLTVPDPPLTPHRVRGVAYITSDSAFKLQASWNYPMLGGSRDPFTAYFLVQYKEGEFGAWSASATVPGTSYDSGSLPSGTYYIRVAAVNIYDDQSEWVETGQILLAIIPQVIDSTPVVGTPLLLALIQPLGIQSTARIGTPLIAREDTIYPRSERIASHFGQSRIRGDGRIQSRGIESQTVFGQPTLPGETGYSGTIAPLGGSDGMTLIHSGSRDDSFVSLPDIGFDFPFYNGVYRTNIYIGSNSYITFGFGSSQYFDLSPQSPGRGLLVTSGDRSYQQVFFSQDVPGQKCRIRFEGGLGTSGAIGAPTLLWEATLFADGTIQLATSSAYANDGLSVITDGSGYFTYYYLVSNLSVIFLRQSETNYTVAIGSYTT